MIPLLIASHLSMLLVASIFSPYQRVTCIGVTRGNGEIQFRGVEGRGDAHVILVLGALDKKAGTEPGPNRKCRKKRPPGTWNIPTHIWEYICIYIYVGYLYVYGLYIYIYV